MKKEEQFLKVEIKLADKILEQFKEEAFFVIHCENEFLDKILHLLSLDYVEKSPNHKYMIVPGEGIWPYEESSCPCFYATEQFDPIPLIIGLDKIRVFLEEWNPDQDFDFKA
ncbi:MAG: hypothetical protein RH860_12125 [Cytophagales bacterium]